MRHKHHFFLVGTVSIIITSCASFPQQELDDQADKIAIKTKSTLTHELARLFSFFKNSGKKFDKIMYRTRDDFDAIIYDAQKQYYDQDQN